MQGASRAESFAFVSVLLFALAGLWITASPTPYPTGRVGSSPEQSLDGKQSVAEEEHGSR